MARSALDVPTFARAVAAGWRWDPAWASWKCPVSHLVSDQQVGADPERRCWLCVAEEQNPSPPVPRPATSQTLTTTPFTPAVAYQTPSHTNRIVQVGAMVVDWDDWDGRLPARKRKPKAPSEPEPTLARKGRRYDLDED